MVETIKMLLAAVVFCAITGMASAGCPWCHVKTTHGFPLDDLPSVNPEINKQIPKYESEYIECVLEGISERDSEIEAFIASLNNTQHGKDVIERCASLNERIARCEAKKTNWPASITKPWEERMKDALYVDFLMSLGKEFCKSPQQMEEIKNCFTDELQAAVKSCVAGGPNPNIACIQQKYRSLEQCPDSADNFFISIVQSFLSRNPYWAPGAQVSARSDPTSVPVTAGSDPTSVQETGRSDPTSFKETGRSDPISVQVTGSSDPTSFQVTGSSDTTGAQVSSRSEPTDQCQYLDCVYEAAPRSNSELELYLSHFLAQRNDVSERCTSFSERATRCESKKANCPTSVTKPWEERMKESVYVEFLMILGKDFCKDPQKLKELSSCFTEELRSTVHSCVTGPSSFNVSCVFEEYNKREQCSASADELFAFIIDSFLSRNPYRSQSSQATQSAQGTDISQATQSAQGIDSSQSTQSVQGTDISQSIPSGNTKDQCAYVDCVLEGNQGRNSEVEMYLGHFLSQNADNVAERCAALIDRTGSCEAKKINCPTTVTKPWEERMKDPVYVEFLMALGKDFCKDPEQLKNLRNCVTDELHTAIQGCSSEGPNFNSTCVQDQYSKLEKCESNSDEFFAAIFSWFLSKNPYRTESPQLRSIKRP